MRCSLHSCLYPQYCLLLCSIHVLSHRLFIEHNFFPFPFFLFLLFSFQFFSLLLILIFLSGLRVLLQLMVSFCFLLLQYRAGKCSSIVFEGSHSSICSSVILTLQYVARFITLLYMSDGSNFSVLLYVLHGPIRRHIRFVLCLSQGCPCVLGLKICHPVGLRITWSVKTAPRHQFLSITTVFSHTFPCLYSPTSHSMRLAHVGLKSVSVFSFAIAPSGSRVKMLSSPTVGVRRVRKYL